MFILAQSPMTWAGVAERLGIPFAILLFVLFALCWIASWCARNVAKPVVAAHVTFMDRCGTSLEDLKKQAIEQKAALEMLKDKGEEAIAAVDEVRADVKEVDTHVRQVKGMVSSLHRKRESEGGETLPAA